MRNLDRQAILSLATSRCGRLFSSSYDGSIRVWDAATHNPMRPFRGKHQTMDPWPLCLIPCAYMRGVSFGCGVVPCRFYYPPLFRQQRWHGKGEGPTNLFLSMPFPTLSCLTLTLIGWQVWDIKSHKLVATVEGPQGAFCTLAVEAGRLFTGAHDGAVRVWQ